MFPGPIHAQMIIPVFAQDTDRSGWWDQYINGEGSYQRECKYFSDLPSCEQVSSARVGISIHLSTGIFPKRSIFVNNEAICYEP